MAMGSQWRPSWGLESTIIDGLLMLKSVATEAVKKRSYRSIEVEGDSIYIMSESKKQALFLKYNSKGQTISSQVEEAPSHFIPFGTK